MALWRDPLDELIADLERALPPASQPSAIDWQMVIVGCQLLLDAVLRGTPEDVARVEREPEVQAYLKRFPRLRDAREPPRAPQASPRGDEP